jgi:hypothetical protein
LREIHDLAARLREEGEVIDARKVQEETLRVSSLLYGEGSYDTQVSMSQLGRTLRALGEMAAARKLHEAVVELRRRYLGDYHPYTLNSMKILADTLGAQGALLESERLHNRIQHLRTVAAGGDFSGSLFEITENSYFYSQYMRLFREGVFQCSRKHADETTGKVLTWSYVSGAIRFGDSERWLTREK